MIKLDQASYHLLKNDSYIKIQFSNLPSASYYHLVNIIYAPVINLSLKGLFVIVLKTNELLPIDTMPPWNISFSNWINFFNMDVEIELMSSIEMVELALKMG